MSIHKVNLFANLYPELNSLSDTLKEKVLGLIFSYRSGEETVAVSFTDRDSLAAVAGRYIKDVPEGSIYYVDLNSLATDKVRIWVDKREESVMLRSYYVNQQGSVFEYKIYNHTPKDDPRHSTIDRYDFNMNLISADEPEFRCTKSDWKGNPHTLSIIEENNMNALFIKKGLKDQNYVCVNVRH